jgi:glycine cleavage system H protein
MEGFGPETGGRAMTTLMEILEALGSFLVGSAGRLGIFLVAGLVLLVPAALLGGVFYAIRARRERDVAREGSGLAWRHGAWHAPNHTWLAPAKGGELTVGLDDLARRIVPSATAVDLPAPGMMVHRGDPILVVHAGGRTVRIGAPIDGEVRRVNGRVRRDPDLVKREPYGGGWLFTLAPADGAHESFPREAEARGWMRSEERRLARFVEDELGLAAADGGALVAPLPAALGEDGWRKVVAAFLGVG